MTVFTVLVQPAFDRLHRLVVVALALLALTWAAPLPVHAQVLAYVTDAGLRSGGGCDEHGAVHVIDTSTDTVVASIPVDAFPAAIAASPDGKRLYVRHEAEPARVWCGFAAAPGTVSVIDTSTRAVVATIVVGTDWLAEVAITPDGTRLYVGNAVDNTVSVIDTGSNTVIETIAIATAGVAGLAVSPDGKYVYVGEWSGTVWIIDTATNLKVGSIPVGNGPDTIAFTPNGTRAFTANWDSSSVSVIDTTTRSVIDTFLPGPIPTGVAVHPDGTTLYVARWGSSYLAIVDLATRAITQLFVGPEHARVAFTPGGAKAYVSSRNAVHVIDTATPTVLGSIPIGTSLSHIVIAERLPATPQAAIGVLLDAVAELEAAGTLNRGQANSLRVKLDGALEQLDKGKTRVARQRLSAFINHVESLVADGVLSPSEGQPLIAGADAAIAML